MNPSLRQKCILWGSAGGSGLLLMGCVVILYAQCRPTWVMWTPAAKIQDGVAHCWPTDILVDYSIVVGGALSFFFFFFFGLLAHVHACSQAN